MFLLRVIFALIFVVEFSSCIGPNLSTKPNPLFAKYPIRWDAKTRSAIPRDVRGEAGPFEGVLGAFRKTERSQVEQFVQTLHQRFLFQSYIHENLKGEPRVEENEDDVIVYSSNPFEVESLAIGMIKSKLFSRVYPYSEGLGDGGEAEVRVERSSLFDTPESPSVSQVLPKLENFFTSYLTSRNPEAQVSVGSENVDSYQFVVFARGLRNTIVKAGKYWENIEIAMRIFPRFGADKEGLVVTFRTSGKYASGIGSKPPPPKKFKDLDDYYDEIREWNEQLSTVFEKHFRIQKAGW